MRFNCISFIFLLAIAANAQERQSVTVSSWETQTTFCQMKVSQQWQMMDMSFNVIYTFDVDYERGTVTNTQGIRTRFVQPGEIDRCLSQWRFWHIPELRDDKFVVIFQWKHGLGWVRQDLSYGLLRQVWEKETNGK